MINNIHIHHTEQTILGTFIAGGGVYFLNQNLLHKNYFSSEQHQYLFSVIEKFHKKGIPVDIYLLLQEIESNKQLPLIGGKEYLKHLLSLEADEENLPAYYEILKEENMRTEMKKLGEQFILYSMQPELKVDNIFKNAILKLEQQLEISYKENTKSLIEIMTSIFKSFNKKSNQLFLTGIDDIDAQCGGIEKGAITLLGGRTGMGKTAFLLNMAINVAEKNRATVGFITLAENNQILTKRSLDTIDKICIERKLNKKVFAEEIGSRIIFCDQHIRDTESLLSSLQRMVNLHQTELIIIDYLQLLGQGNYRRHHELDIILRKLKTFAFKNNIALVIVSQLSRSVETRGGGKKPEISDLRDCGTLEEVAEMIWLLYRPSYYGLTVDDYGNDASNITELIVAKNSHGATGTIYLKSDSYLPSYTSYSDDAFISKIDINRIKEIIE